MLQQCHWVVASRSTPLMFRVRRLEVCLCAVVNPVGWWKLCKRFPHGSRVDVLRWEEPISRGLAFVHDLPRVQSAQIFLMILNALLTNNTECFVDVIGAVFKDLLWYGFFYHFSCQFLDHSLEDCVLSHFLAVWAAAQIVRCPTVLRLTSIIPPRAVADRWGHHAHGWWLVPFLHALS